MDDLTHDQKEEILKHCDDNQDYDFGTIAYHFSKKFGKPVSRDVVYTLFIQKEMGRFEHSTR